MRSHQCCYMCLWKVDEMIRTAAACLPTCCNSTIAFSTWDEVTPPGISECESYSGIMYFGIVPKKIIARVAGKNVQSVAKLACH